jgi:hypothetical protein
MYSVVNSFFSTLPLASILLCQKSQNLYKNRVILAQKNVNLIFLTPIKILIIFPLLFRIGP